MVARISAGANPTGAVTYNENKVEKGEAERLAIRNYEGVYQPLDTLTRDDVARRLEDRADLNTRISKPTFHVSLSLAQGEKPDAAELIAIADRYMQGMGYGRQPYAIYQHHDTDHTHVHIVSVRVDEAGKKVSDTYERERSNTLRKTIEKEFGLQIAEKAALRPERGQLLPVEYGKGDLKRDIGEVVNGVLRDFKFSSFSQFNQILSIYNVKATEVAQEGKKPGLVYSAINQDKLAVGATFRASALPYQPTMDRLGRRIDASKKIKADRLPALKRVASTSLTESKGWDDFQQRLSRSGIEVIPHIGKGDSLFGISFVDTKSRAIYTGSELGKSFTAGALKVSLGGEYAPPGLREVAEQTTDSQLKGHAKTQLADRTQNQEVNQTHNQQPETPMQNMDLVRGLLFALGQEDSSSDNDHELKKMIKKSRSKPR